VGTPQKGVEIIRKRSTAPGRDTKIVDLFVLREVGATKATVNARANKIFNPFRERLKLLTQEHGVGVGIIYVRNIWEVKGLG
jgi:hypothetical protein